jgi:hypothetical protein
MASTVPAAGARALNLVRLSANPKHAHQSREEPYKSREERESNDGLGLAAWIFSPKSDIVPVEGASAQAVLVLLQAKLCQLTSFSPPVLCNYLFVRETDTYIDEETKGCPPAQADDDIQRPIGQAVGEGDEPDKGEEERNAGNDLGVDGATDDP